MLFDDPGFVLDEILTHLDDFIRSYPAEAVLLFEYLLSVNLGNVYRRGNHLYSERR